jgi:CheY-like chemotaxis protein
VRPRILVVDDSATVRMLVERTLARAGYDVTVASDGAEALDVAQASPPDLVLLDFVMPRMNGFQFAQALRGIANLRHVPIVLMSARAHRIGAQFLAQTGAVDAIAKPFAPEALLAVTAHSLQRAAASGADRAAAASTVDEPGLDDTAEEPLDLVRLGRASAPPPRPSHPPPDAGLAAKRGSDPNVLANLRAEAARRCAACLAEGLRPLLGPLLLESVDAETLAAKLLEGGIEPLVEAVDIAYAASPGSSGITALEGRIEYVGLGDVLQMLQMQQQTGVLEVVRGRRRIAICLRGGLVDLALAQGVDPEFLLGRYLREEELLEREDLDALLARRPAGGPRGLLGDRLVKLGYITAEDLRHALTRQTSELIYEALRWREGRYRFAKWAVRPEADAARLGVPVASVLMEGLRRVDEWRLIEEQIPSFDIVFERNEDAVGDVDVDELAREERAVLAAVDGVRSVRAIVDAVDLGSFVTCKAMFQLATSRLIRPRRRPLAG